MPLSAYKHEDVVLSALLENLFHMDFQAFVDIFPYIGHPNLTSMLSVSITPPPKRGHTRLVPAARATHQMNITAMVSVFFK